MASSLARVAAALICFVVLHKSAPAADLSIGDHAPRLAVGRWIKGEPIQRLEPGRIYVVEFSATFCGVSIEIAPHLSSLQERYPYFLNGQAVQARTYEEKAVALPGGDGPEFVKRLEQYRKAVEKESSTKK
jgi:thiol-disulfide isomerase/thioredoxin